MSVEEEKALLRGSMFERRNALDTATKRMYDRQICDRLRTMIRDKACKVVHAYLPIKGEIDISPVLKWMLNEKIKVICPKVLPKRQLENLELLSYGDFEAGPFNTYHPASNKVHTGEIDFVIMPGLAFDQVKNRLGYGGGYYDRFLIKHPEAYLAAVFYPFQLVDRVPVEAHDVKMNTLIYPDLKTG